MIEINDRLTEAALVTLVLMVGSFIAAVALAVIFTLLANALMGAVWAAKRMRQAFASWKARR